MALDLSSAALNFALDAVERASVLAREIQSGMAVAGLTKSDRSPVTVADFAGQAIIAKALTDAFPSATLVGEEGADELRHGDNSDVLDALTNYVASVIEGADAEAICDWIDIGQADPNDEFWTVDPIDGTKGFLRGGQYAVALAFIQGGEVQLGVLGCPNLGTDCSLQEKGGGVLVAAVRGQGTWATPMSGPRSFARLEVSACSNVREARLLRSYVSAHTNTDQLHKVSETLGIKTDPVALDSQAKYAILASGGGELLFRLLSSKQPDYKEKIWDQAAGSIVVEEAGGRITDLAGRPLDFTQGRSLLNNRGVCATNGILHDVALEVLGQLV